MRVVSIIEVLKTFDYGAGNAAATIFAPWQRPSAVQLQALVDRERLAIGCPVRGVIPGGAGSARVAPSCGLNPESSTSIPIHESRRLEPESRGDRCCSTVAHSDDADQGLGQRAQIAADGNGTHRGVIDAVTVFGRDILERQDIPQQILGYLVGHAGRIELDRRHARSVAHVSLPCL